jgi:hypothetical protein
MAVVELSGGETREVIPADQSGERYAVDVLEGQVSFGHSKRYASDNYRHGPEAHGRLSSLRGGKTGSHTLYVHAHTDARVEVRSEGFVFEALSNVVATSGESTARNSNRADGTLSWDTHISNPTTAAGSDNKVVMIPKGTSGVQQVIGLSAEPLESMEQESVSIRWDTNNNSTNTPAQIGTTVHQGPLWLDPPMPVANEGSLVARVSNHSSSSVDLKLVATYRE